MFLLLLCVLQPAFSLHSSITESCIEAYRKDVTPNYSDSSEGSSSVQATLKEFPHFAAIGWMSENEVFWGCGGSLITPKFILTAAHCTSRYAGGKNVPPNVARMGAIELDISGIEPWHFLFELTKQYKSQEDTAQEIHISRMITHPEYTFVKQYRDIALMELEHAAQITPFVIPICLWDRKSEVFTNLEAPGFGEVEFGNGISPHLNKVTLTRVGFEECRKVYDLPNRKLPKGLIAEQHICANDKTGAEMDTCQG